MSETIRTLLDFYLLCLMAITVIAIASSKSIVETTILQSVFSILATIIYSLIGSMDVAITEAAIGAGVSATLTMNVIGFLGKNALYAHQKKGGLNFSIVFVLAAICSYVSLKTGLWKEFGRLLESLDVKNYYVSVSQNAGIGNPVTMILASVRGYDTMWETCVVSIAAIGISFVLEECKDDPNDIITHSKTKKISAEKKIDSGNKEIISSVSKDITLSTTSFLVIPFIIMTALYLQFNGEDSPGGGFQAGAIAATGLFACSICSGDNLIPKRMSLERLRLCLATGLGIYLATGIACVIKGREFLNFEALSLHNGHIIGSSIVEAGVGLAVFSAITLFYTSFSFIKKENI